jgi:hypothetical protein
MSRFTLTDGRAFGSRSVVGASIGALVAAAFWVGMTAAFHLTFHLQPMLVGIASGWAVRRTARPGWTAGQAMVVLVASAAGLTGGILAIAAIHGPTDALPVAIVVGSAGVAVGDVLLARPPAGERQNRVEGLDAG